MSDEASREDGKGSMPASGTSDGPIATDPDRSRTGKSSSVYAHVGPWSPKFTGSCGFELE